MILNNGGDEVGQEASVHDELVKLKAAFTTLQSEQEDLLMMLSDQDAKLRGYKKTIKGLGQPISDEDEDLDLDLSDWLVEKIMPIIFDTTYI